MAYKSNEFSTLASQGSYISYSIASERIPLLEQLQMESGTVNAYENTSRLRDFKESGIIRVISGKYVISADVELGVTLKIPVDSDEGTANEDFFQWLLARCILNRFGTGQSLETTKRVLASWIVAYTTLGNLTSTTSVDAMLKDDTISAQTKQEFLIEDPTSPYKDKIESICVYTMHSYLIASGLIGLWSLNLGQDLYSLLVTPSNT